MLLSVIVVFYIFFIKPYSAIAARYVSKIRGTNNTNICVLSNPHTYFFSYLNVCVVLAINKIVKWHCFWSRIEPFDETVTFRVHDINR